MKKDRFKFNAVVNFIIEKDNKILLMKRSDGFFEGGYWVVPAGHMDGNETAADAAIRELKEELDIDVKREDIEFAHVVHTITQYLERIDFFFKVKAFEGEIKNVEHTKCDEIKFFDYDNLPPYEQMDKTTLKVINAIKEGKFYSEKGFDQGYKGFSDIDKFTFDTLHNAIEKRAETKNVEKPEYIDNEKDLKSQLGDVLENLFLYAHNNGIDVKEVIYNKFKKQKRSEQAKEYYASPTCNCAQGVAKAFCDLMGLSHDDAAAITKQYGAGRVEGVCGAVMAMRSVANFLNNQKNMEHPANITEETAEILHKMMNDFAIKNGSVICKELKGAGAGVQLRSCMGCVEDASEILEEYLKK